MFTDQSSAKAKHISYYRQNSFAVTFWTLLWFIIILPPPFSSNTLLNSFLTQETKPLMLKKGPKCRCQSPPCDVSAFILTLKMTHFQKRL